MIKLLFKEKQIFIDDWTPYFFVIRDLLFDGKWDDLLNVSVENDFLFENIQKAREIETLFPDLKVEDYFPTTPSEIRSFFEYADIELSELKNNCDLDSIYDFANEALINDEYKMVEEYSELILDIDENSAYGFDLLGTLKYDQGEIEESVKYLKKAIAIDKDMIEPLSTLAQAYFNNKEYVKAAGIWKSMIEKNPDDVIAYFTLVDSYINLNDFTSAIDVLKALIGRFPNHLMGKVNLVSLLTIDGKLEEALKYEAEIEKTKPKNPTEMEIWANVNMKKEKYDIVETGIKEYLSKHEGPSFLRLWLVVPYIKDGRLSEAKAIIDDFKDSNILFNYGKHEIFDRFLNEKEIWASDLP
jgi:tetratricopeptide (TPR) repeat protein